MLPPYVYTSDWREMKQHVSAVIAAPGLSCMLYNNPVAYRTDFLPVQIAELAGEHPNLAAVKESSADIRRIAAIREILEDRLRFFVGVDDALVGLEGTPRHTAPRSSRPVRARLAQALRPFVHPGSNCTEPSWRMRRNS